MDLTIIQNKIYEIRGERVMLDKDLAELYQVETAQLKRAVKRNLDRFPSDFMFELTQDESKSLEIKLRCQIGILETTHFKYAPMAFTEQGVAMLSGVLNSKIAIEVNISIMRAFITMRRYLLDASLQNKEIEMVKKEIGELKQYIEDVFTDYNDINEDTSLQLGLILVQSGRGRWR